MKKLLYSTLILGFFTILFIGRIAAQQIRCGTDKIHIQKLLDDPLYKSKYENTIRYLNEMEISQYKTVLNGSQTEFHVPVVVHIFHTGGSVGTAYNPTDAAINAFIAHINEGFSNTNDVSTVPGTYNSVNLPIRFYLAQRNELNSCAATNGINRINFASNAAYLANGIGSPGISDQVLMSQVHWNDLDYYNIYIVNKIDGEDGTCASCTYTAGYAYFPVLGGNSSDGMVVLASQVGTSSNVFIHELGHAFNLIHPFEGGSSSLCPSNTNCTTDNDKVCDTDPIQLDFSCNPSGNNPCTGTSWAGSTTQFNYMSYFACNDRFTNGQSIRINNALNLIRSGYKNSAGVDAPSPLPVNISAPSFAAANVGNSFDFGPIYVGLNSIDYNSGTYTSEGAGSVYYKDHTCNQSTTLIKTNTYPITVKTKLNPNMVRVFIDYNNDGSFGTSAPEMVFSSNGPAGDFTHSGTLAIPASGVVFNTPLRMRVIGDFNSGTITATSTLQYGQAEDYTVIIQPSALPIQWKNFTARMIDAKSVELLWSTEMEINNDYFEIEKSNDGIVYSSIAKVNGQKEKYTPSYYSAFDKNPNNGKNFYRIKQVDIDQQSSYSDIRIVEKLIPSLNINTFPNPSNDVLHVDIESQNETSLSLVLCDLNGKQIYKSYINDSKGHFHTVINTSNLQTGIYILQICSDSDARIIKFVKE